MWFARVRRPRLRDRTSSRDARRWRKFSRPGEETSEVKRRKSLQIVPVMRSVMVERVVQSRLVLAAAFVSVAMVEILLRGLISW